jgi:hypothetical protein
VKLSSGEKIKPPENEVYIGSSTIDACGFANKFSYFQTQRNNIDTNITENTCDI